MSDVLQEMKYCNVITIAEFSANEYSFDDLKQISKDTHQGKSLLSFPSCKILGLFNNLVMNTWKDQYNLDLWNQAVNLTITNQTSAPIGNETMPISGILYQVPQAFETNRVQGNPYYISYGITEQEADGMWGSLIWSTATNQMINRVRTSVRKDSGKIVFVELKASLI